MNIAENFLLLISYAILLGLVISIAKYLYIEQCFEKNKSWLIFGILFFLTEIVTIFLAGKQTQDYMLLIWLLFFCTMIFITRKKRRIRGLFLIFPIIGITASIEMIPFMIIMMFSGLSYESIYKPFKYYEIIYNAGILILIHIFIKRSKTLHKRTELGIWERRILNANGLLLFAIYCIVINIPKSFTSYKRYIILGCIFIAIMIIVTTILMTMESANASFYKAVAEMNEHYLQAQLKHFKSFQETQQETRRIRHDMKNHIICMNDLLERGENEKLSEYLKELTDITQNIDKELHIGNDIADAIINEKYATAKSNGIQINLEGSLTGIDSIAAIDLCTIFANAMDNALEAVMVPGIKEPFITINIKRNKKLLFLSFLNPCLQNITLQNGSVKTTKNDTLNHGFGLNNIHMAVEKYKGDMKCSILSSEDNPRLFNLEIMLMV